MSKVISVNESNFEEEVINSSLPVLLEFGASWCGPCHRQLPILEGLSKEYTDKLKVVKVDIDESSNLCDKYSIKSVPTLLLFNNGQLLQTKAGLSNLEFIKFSFLPKVGI